MDWKTIKCTVETYNLIKGIADKANQPMASVADSMLGAGVGKFQSAVAQLAHVGAKVEEIRAMGAALGAQESALGTAPGAGNLQLGNPHDNTEKAESAAIVAEAVAHPDPEIDESGDRGEESGLVSPESENEHETGAGKWIALAFLALLAVGQLQRLANQDIQASFYRAM